MSTESSTGFTPVRQGVFPSLRSFFVFSVQEVTRGVSAVYSRRFCFLQNSGFWNAADLLIWPINADGSPSFSTYSRWDKTL